MNALKKSIRLTKFYPIRKKKQAYDQFGHAAFEQGAGYQPGAGQQQGYGPGGFRYYTYNGGNQQDVNFDMGGFSDPFEIFEAFFGGSSFGQSARRQTQTYRLKLSFNEAIHGTEKEVSLDSKKIKIKIPAGVDNGSRIRFGDFYILTEVTSSPIFQREGQDIHIELPISFVQAALGDVVKAPTIYGDVKLRIPAGTQGGTIIRLRSQGVLYPRKSAKGDEYVHIKLVTPKKLSPKEKALFEELKNVSKNNDDKDNDKDNSWKWF